MHGKLGHRSPGQCVYRSWSFSGAHWKEPNRSCALSSSLLPRSAFLSPPFSSPSSLLRLWILIFLLSHRRVPKWNFRTFGCYYFLSVLIGWNSCFDFISLCQGPRLGEFLVPRVLSSSWKFEWFLEKTTPGVSSACHRCRCCRINLIRSLFPSLESFDGCIFSSSFLINHPHSFSLMSPTWFVSLSTNGSLRTIYFSLVTWHAEKRMWVAIHNFWCWSKGFHS